MVRFIYSRISIQTRVAHHAINQVIDHYRDVIHASKSIIECRFGLELHMRLLFLKRSLC